MKSGADQLRDWMTRRFPESARPQRDTAEFLGWDETFIAKLLSDDPSQQRKPGLQNAILLERKTGIPVEAWVSSELDETTEAVSAGRGKSQSGQGDKRRAS